MQHTFQPVVLAIVASEGRYLLTLRNDKTSDGDNGQFYGMWQLPGGKAEFGEQLEDALVRECMEETGIHVNIDAVVPYVQSITQGSWQGIFIPYLCHMRDTAQEVLLNEEASQFGWYTYEEAQALHLMPLVSRILETAHIMQV